MDLFGSVNLVAQTGGIANLIPAKVWWLRNPDDWRFAGRWKQSSSTVDDSSASDSIEYALLGRKRWKFLRQQNLCVTGWEDLARHLAADHAAELGMALALTHTVSGRTSVLGFSFVRRTWANNLILEFLAGSPAALSTVKGIGTVLIQGVAAVGVWLGSEELWGECTEASRGFYCALKRRLPPPAVECRGQLPDQITDRFQFDRMELGKLAGASSIEMEPCPSRDLKP